MISNRRTVLWRVLVLMLTSPLLALGLAGVAHAAALAPPFVAPPFVPDEPDPEEPPPPCPSRTDFTQNIGEAIKTPAVSRRGSGSTYLVVFTLQPAHAFNPPDPNGCTGSDRVVSKLGPPSTNIVSGSTLLQDQQTAVKELVPADSALPMVYHFKILFHKNFNTTGNLNPKRDARWCLVIPVMAPGTVQNIAPYQCVA